jgi:thioredoxin reductase
MSSMDREIFDLAIVGAGPGGLSAAARASQNGLSHVLLEAADKHANTVQQYQRRKHVMAEPSLLPLRSDVAFAAGRREGILDEWQESIRRSKLNVRFRAEVVGISGERGAFRVLLKGGDFILAKHIVLALGVQGNPRMLGIPGEDHPRVQTTLECADLHRGEAILVIGAGDSAIENALSLCDHNQVILINRGADFKKAKHSNGLRVANAIQSGKIRCHSQSRVLRIEPDTNGCIAMLSTPAGEIAQRCDRIILRLGAIPPRGFLEPIGVRFVSTAADALPALSPQLESSLPGLYIIGALAGYPLIKQAMNQGYDVVERLMGNELEPADHPVLETMLRRVPFGQNVDEALSMIGSRVLLLRRIAPLTLRELVLASKVRVPESGHELVVRGEYTNSVFNVLQGVVYLYAPDSATMEIGAGQMFGALSLISGRPSDTTAVAGSDCVLLETPRSVVKKLLRTEKRAQAYLTRVYVLRALKRYLMPQAMSETILALAATATTQNFAAGEVLFSEATRSTGCMCSAAVR